MTWTIRMSEKELQRKTWIDKAIDKRISQKAVADKLGISERQARRRISRYRERGDIGLVSGSRGRPGNRRLNADVAEKVRQFICDPLLTGFGPTLLRDKLFEMEGIALCKETLRKMLIAEGLHVAKVKKPKAMHPPRGRRERRGELVQIDGSYHAWLEERGPKGCLLLFVDDATSGLLVGEFVETESYFSYSDLCKRYFRKVGVPVALYSDRFSVAYILDKNLGTRNINKEQGQNKY